MSNYPAGVNEEKRNVSLEVPYSGIIDWEEEDKKRQEEKLRYDQSRQKIQRTNALGEAFRLLIDTVGAGKNATVAPRAVNPGILGASQAMERKQSEYDQRGDRWKLTEINDQQRVQQNQLDKEERARQREFQAEQQKGQQDWYDQRDATNFGQQKEMAEISKNDQAELYGVASKHRMNENAQESNLRKEQDAIGDIQNPIYARWRRTYGNAKPYMAIPDLETGMDIPLSDTDAAQILKWMRKDPTILNSKSASSITNNLVFKNLVVENWDRYRPLVLKLASGQPITKEDEKLFYSEAERSKRIGDYKTKSSDINTSRRRGQKQLEALNKEYSDLFVEDEPGQAGPAGAEGGALTLKPEEGAKIERVINAEGYTPDLKRSAVYDYLIKQGYDQDKAKEFAEFVYSNLK